jgi:hypothetical protein
MYKAYTYLAIICPEFFVEQKIIKYICITVLISLK